MQKLSPVCLSTLSKFLRLKVFNVSGIEGDHMVFTKPGVLRPVVIPKYANVQFL
jgi:hypothetical protein